MKTSTVIMITCAIVIVFIVGLLLNLWALPIAAPAAAAAVKAVTAF